MNSHHQQYLHTGSAPLFIWISSSSLKESNKTELWIGIQQGHEALNPSPKVVPVYWLMNQKHKPFCLYPTDTVVNAQTNLSWWLIWKRPQKFMNIYIISQWAFRLSTDICQSSKPSYIQFKTKNNFKASKYTQTLLYQSPWFLGAQDPASIRAVRMIHMPP